jgi:RNA polymerase sigma-70 factor (ECF subfamily)
VSAEHQTGVLLDNLFRREAGRIAAHLARLLGSARLDLAEEIVQETMVRALQVWPYEGVPENPTAWLFRVAKNAAIDAVRRERTGAAKEAVLATLRGDVLHSHPEPNFEEELRDDELRMIFMCCHPDIALESRVALSLKTVGGLSVGEIAKALLSDDAAIAQRLVRAKRHIRDRGLALELPSEREMEQRLDSVLQVVYLIFNEGYAAHEGADLVRRDLCAEALRLGRLIAESSIAAPRVHALVALIALQAARIPARTDAAGELVLLEEQDRALWDDRLISMGFHYFERSMAGDRVSEYHVQAAIAATHARAGAGQAPDWPVIVELYDQLLALNPSPVVALNRAVAIAKVRGAQEALAAIDTLAADPKMRDYYLYLAIRGHLLHDLDRPAEAAECFRAALECRCSEPEVRFLQRKLVECLPTESLPPSSPEYASHGR